MRTKLKPINELIVELNQENSTFQTYKGYLKREEERKIAEQKERDKKERDKKEKEHDKTVTEYKTEMAKAQKRINTLMKEIKKRDYE